MLVNARYSKSHAHSTALIESGIRSSAAFDVGADGAQTPPERSWVMTAFALTAFAMLASGCGRDEGKGQRAPAEAIPEKVLIGSATITEGVSDTPIQQKRNVSTFRITTTPITVARYRMCVDAQVCKQPAWTKGLCDRDRGSSVPVDGWSYSTDPQWQELPVTCVTPAQAADYCRWIGGRLPTTAEWLLAARGPEIQRYPWGKEPPTCERQFRMSFVSSSQGCCGDCMDPQAASVGKHRAGTSPSGVQDVLMTHGELIGPDEGSLWAGCRAPGEGCFAAGQGPGAIDSIRPAWIANDEGFPAGFRCAWNGGA